MLRGGYGIYYGRITNGELLTIASVPAAPNSQYNAVYKVNHHRRPTLPNIRNCATGAARSHAKFLLPGFQSAQS